MRVKLIKSKMPYPICIYLDGKVCFLDTNAVANYFDFVNGEVALFDLNKQIKQNVVTVLDIDVPVDIIGSSGVHDNRIVFSAASSGIACIAGPSSSSITFSFTGIGEQAIAYGSSANVIAFDSNGTGHEVLVFGNANNTITIVSEGALTVTTLPTPVAPDAPALTIGDSRIIVNWASVPNAATYEVWYYTSDASGSASKFGSDVSGTTATITGLNNNTTYYVWLKATNATGTSGFSPSSSMVPHAAGWSNLTEFPNNYYPRAITGAQLTSNSVMAIGNMTLGPSVVGKKCYILTYANGTASWSSTGDLNYGRTTQNSYTNITWPRLNNGKILVAGNVNSTGTANKKKCELYDPNSGTWSITGDLNTGREIASHPILMSDGKVFLIGGHSGAAWVGTPEVYDPDTELWSTKADAPSGLITREPILLGDGTILVAFNDSPSNHTVQRYNPTNNTWTTNGAYIGAYLNNSGTWALADDGNVYMFGMKAGSLNTVYKYSVSNNTFTQLTSTANTIVGTSARNIPGTAYIELLFMYNPANSQQYGRLLYNTANDTFSDFKQFVTVDVGSSTSTWAHGLIAGNPVVYGTDIDYTYPYTAPEMLYPS